MKNKIGAKGNNNIWMFLILAGVVLFALGVFDKKAPTDLPDGYAADAGYSTFNMFGTESVGGTTYYVDGGIATTTAPKLTRGKSYTYWVSNGSIYYVKPKSFTSTGSDNVLNKEAYKNGSVTISAYDVIYNCNTNTNVATDSCNMSLAANVQSKIDVKYLGGAKTANLPFGGVMVVEYNNTVPTQTCSGDGIVGPNSNFQVTYQDSAVTNTHKVYELAAGFDISKNGGQTGVTNVIRCEFVNGATAAAAGSMKVTFIPANYYLGNDGKIYLDVEQKVNGVTTRTGFTNGDLTKTFYTQ